MRKIDKLQKMNIKEFAEWYYRHASCSTCDFSEICDSTRKCGMMSYDWKDCVNTIMRGLMRDDDIIENLKIGDIIRLTMDFSGVPFVVMSDRFANNLRGITIEYKNLRSYDILSVERINSEGKLEKIWETGYNVKPKTAEE